MKLLKLSCDQPTFKTLHFNPEGVTLIVGDSSKNDSMEGSSNGVGKTLTLGLIHHCLGGNANKKLAVAVPNWMFRLDFALIGTQHVIERSGNGKKVFLDGEKTNITALRRWLNEKGPFNLEQGIKGLTFRALISRFGRLKPKDCVEPIATAAESEYDGLMRSSFLLGVDPTLVLSKRDNKLALDSVKSSQENWKTDKVLHEMFRAGSKPKVRAEWLEKEIERIKSDLDAFQVAEDYRQIELTAGQLTKQLREKEKNQEVIRFQIEGIIKSLTRQPDISKDDLLGLYEGLTTLFRKDALAHFNAVEEFHNSLSANRKRRLEQDRLVLQQQVEVLEKERAAIAQQRDELLQSLQGKRALDEYAALAKKYASLQEEAERLQEFLSYSDNLQERIQGIKEKRVEEDRKATEYARTNPLESMDKRFKKLAELLYPNLPAGILMESNDGNNQIRYDLSVTIEGEDSDGINAARIVIFDWLVAMYGANHSMGFLWHDNRLFAHMDPLPRAKWFSQVLRSLKGTGKQYIASLNTENYDAMNQHLSEKEQRQLKLAKKLVLHGDDPKNKLLGIQFGSAE
ncbi:MAG: DUF2326 domain-containing protein [Candidatus Thiodiazotropha endolucinida]|uniref:DUF2326 domain-containing protein n=1 Tax=Candidatus Thiodiazotropha taylori TaxID=2792791 RepID=A0A9E4NK00_9GAMM|nr:DUF2326 domain-containing protein [Candidatus Thiodiazotropha taylori]MCW4236551.1 DUF2326 domain-containing protein [Candidatus Thiodiazotropha endolucinida]